MKLLGKCKNLVKYLPHIFVVALALAFIGGIILSICIISIKPVNYNAILIALMLMLIEVFMMTFLIPMIIKINNGNEEDYFKEKAKEVIDAYIEKDKPKASQKNNEVTKK